MNNGGSAFPEIRSERDQNGINDVYSVGGMSLRDYFAAHAISGALEQLKSDGETPYSSAIAKGCYEIADKMLEVREIEK